MKEELVNALHEYFQAVKSHDYSFEYSDDHRYWKAGSKSQDDICARIEFLVKKGDINPNWLLKSTIETVPEQFNDGLTHRIINMWFKPYLK